MSEQIRSTEQEVPLGLFTPSKERKGPSVDMAQVVGKQDILFVCLDTLRYDAAVEEEERGGTPVLNRYGSWENVRRQGILRILPIMPCLQDFCPADMMPNMWQIASFYFSPSP